MPGFIRKAAKNIIVTANISITVCMLLLYILPYASQKIAWFINLLALIFPILLIIQFLFFIFWLIIKPRFAVIPIVSCLLCWGLINSTIALRTPEKFQAKADSSLRIATWNTHMLNFFENNGTLDEGMLRTAKSFNADVLAMQEFVFSLDSNSAISLENVKHKLGYKYVAAANDRAFGVHTYPELHKERYHPFCVALFSNYPILHWKKIQTLKDYNHTFLIADLKIGNDTVRIFNIHLQSMHFVNQDYDFIENIEKKDAETVNQNSRKIARKMKVAYVLRANQAREVKAQIDESPYPVIVCGDMNDVPNSYAYQIISKGLQDAFVEKGSGIGPTFQYLSPTLRIDYVLHSSFFETRQVKIIRPSPSDHNPVIADFNLRK